MVFFLQQIFKYFCEKGGLDKLVSFLKKHSFKSIAEFITMVCVAYIAFIFLTKNHRYEVQSDSSDISYKALYLAQRCGQGAFITWATIGDYNINPKPVIFKFQDVISANGSVKYHNPIYKDSYELSANDHRLLDNLNEGEVVKHRIIDNVAIANDSKRPPEMLQFVITNANLPLSDIRYVVHKDFARNIVYVFSLSFAENAERKCSNGAANNDLINLTNI